MQVVISGGGRFHLFDLARQLQKRNSLRRLITSYPRYQAVRSGIPADKVQTVLIKEIIFRGWNIFPPILRSCYNPQYLACDVFDRRACSRLTECDIFTGLSSFSLRTMRRARSLGAVTVLERGSAHLLYQQEILKEEHERFGLPFPGAHPKIIEKELAEYEEADWIIVPSHYAKKTFIDKGISEDKVISLPYGVDLSDFRPLPGKDRVFRVVFCGTMSLQKGVHYLLKAFSELKLPDSELLLIGKCPDPFKPILEKYSGYFNWVGPQARNRLSRYYSRGSVFVMNSIQEGMALVQLQAMACGLPLICTTNTGGEDLIEDGEEGFIIPIRDVEALKQKLVFLYENRSLAAEMGKKARARVRRGFSWDDYGREIINHYNKMLK
ncbi:MAG: glycosyltransferase family 4 protein [PVC group bacterium]